MGGTVTAANAACRSSNSRLTVAGSCWRPAATACRRSAPARLTRAASAARTARCRSRLLAMANAPITVNAVTAMSTIATDSIVTAGCRRAQRLIRSTRPGRRHRSSRPDCHRLSSAASSHAVANRFAGSTARQRPRIAARSAAAYGEQPDACAAAFPSASRNEFSLAVVNSA